MEHLSTSSHNAFTPPTQPGSPGFPQLGSTPLLGSTNTSTSLSATTSLSSISPPSASLSSSQPTATTPTPGCVEISRTFIEGLCHHFRLNRSQEDALQTILLQGQDLIQDIRNMLEERFKLNKEQRDNVRRVTGDILYSPMTHKFMNVHLETFMKLSQNPDKYGMKLLFGSPHKEKAVRAFCKEMGTSERGKLQRDLVASVTTRLTSLERFTYNSSSKFKIGSLSVNGDPAITAHNVLLKYGQQSLESSEDDLLDHADAQEGGAPPALKKRKAQGRIPKGGSFWEKVEAWLNSEISSLGGYDLSSSAWKRRVEQLTQADQALFGGYMPQQETWMGAGDLSSQSNSAFGQASASGISLSTPSQQAGRALASLLN
ncbi:hypothetical protein FISHEDRAFT_73328 [Fistulina hepatica ATCC 64428]|uniref:Uncharacterized protein n=1 Tax=Fistulina hepatica ATCC 64428 TaxID=1128425 RepID=A0A0D7ADF5_9AGAR|nr:hypothetical protein FISHEDRAFT_73328 [Fistulina hepatica ATCC 64428]